ncbi:hypothetical protein FB45DRAFT_1051097 [Roridomyces roridus]|uniref:Glycan binding protein Y3-like domain-containing protein n=1 Tax=Roridomyces roridus TaxID=1738132 RepID=A0AAD7CL42_9AGAR|nr:hypothetical protein FB45DRAFT_1051097 [Roridomyces roridus]
MFRATLFVFALLAVRTSAQTGLNFTCSTTGVAASCASFIDTFCSSVGGDLIPQGGSSARCFADTANIRCAFNISPIPNNSNLLTLDTRLHRVEHRDRQQRSHCAKLRDRPHHCICGLPYGRKRSIERRGL